MTLNKADYISWGLSSCSLCGQESTIKAAARLRSLGRARVNLAQAFLLASSAANHSRCCWVLKALPRLRHDILPVCVCLSFLLIRARSILVELDAPLVTSQQLCYVQKAAMLRLSSRDNLDSPGKRLSVRYRLH